MIGYLVAGIVVSYLVGSVPFAYVFGKLVRGVDVRRVGSGNVGGTNLMRSAGKAWGALVIALDLGKGACAAGLVAWLFYRDGMPVSYEVFGVICGAMAVVGHNWPVWLRFHGGKGVAASVGVFFALTPLAAACALGVWFVVLALTRIVSISSMIASLSLTGWNVLFESPRAYTIAGLVLALLIVVMHRANIRRLLTGTELKPFGPVGPSRKEPATEDTASTE
ncbi:MAG: glycerol-3-phosphate 1-O-acyltransferase PlsY [Verrucomicrobia bacterium]|nr:glycerol-3-phosphate 1-O-acyltransferase PlsY [Verrucomicrobiota bacterium]